MVWRKEDPQCEESLKGVRWVIAPFTRGRGLDLGCGPAKPYPHFIGVDNCKDTQLFGIPIKPDVNADVTKLDMFASESMDFCYSSHTLEHFDYEQVPAILKEWMRVLKPGGYLVLYLPDEDAYPKVGEDGANPDHKWNVSESKVLAAMRQLVVGWDLGICEQRHEEREYSILFIFRKGTLESGQTLSYRQPKPEKTVCVVRSGAIGDVLQASSVCAGLKKQGFHVTLLSTLPKCEIMANDPNIDRIIALVDQQIPAQHIGDFWVEWRKRFDRWVNLTNTMEQNLLALPGFVTYEWAPRARHELMDKNYLELQHMLARVPHEPNVRFYATDEEKAWAKAERAKYGEKLIMWVMSGSGHVHKHYPYTKMLIERLGTSTNAEVLTIGDAACVELEAGVRTLSHVHCRSGKWSLRRTLAFIEEVDVLVGPETGILNAASMIDKLPKIVFLSHSTVENLTRDWLNTASYWATKVQCPGRGNNEAPACHQMHFDWEPACRKNEHTGAAECQSQIHPERIWKGLMLALETGRVDE